MKTHILYVSLLLFSVLFTGLNDARSQNICPKDGQVIAGHLDTVTSATQTSRVTRNGVSSVCDPPKPFPGVESVGTQNFNTHTFSPADFDSCVTILFDVGTCGTSVFAVAYLNSYNPANFAENYIGDLGASQTQSFSFVVPAGDSLVLIANSNFGPITCDYSFSIVNYTCNTFTDITLAPETATLTAGEPHTVTATVQNISRQPIAGALVLFEVTSGPNTGEQSDPGSGECSPDDCRTDANGQVSWTYTSFTSGVDTIPASVQSGDVTVLSNPVEARWLGRPIPTLSEWGLIAMAGLAGIIGLFALRRKKAAA